MAYIFQTFSYIDLIAICMPLGGILLGVFLHNRIASESLKLLSLVGAVIYLTSATIYYFNFRSVKFNGGWDLLKITLDMSGGFILIVFILNAIVSPVVNRVFPYFEHERVQVHKDKIKRQKYSSLTFLQFLYYAQILVGLGLFFGITVWVSENDNISGLLFGVPGAMDCAKPGIMETYQGSIQELSTNCGLRFSNFGMQVDKLVFGADWDKIGGISGFLALVLAVITAFFPEIISRIRQKNTPNKKHAPDPLLRIDTRQGDLMDPRRRNQGDDLPWSTDNPDEEWRGTRKNNSGE